MGTDMLRQDDTSISVNKDEGELTLRLGEIVLSGQCYVELQSREGRTRRVRGQKAETIDQRLVSEAHGAGERITARYVPAEDGLALLFEASVYEQRRFVALRVAIENRSDLTFRALVLSPLATVQMRFGSGPLDGWANGFHSWAFTGFVPHAQRQPRPALGLLLTPQSRNPTTEQPRAPGQYAGEEIGILLDEANQALVAGFIGVADQFGQV